MATFIGELVKKAGWDRLQIPYNPNAFFFKYSKSYGLGYPATEEYDMESGRRKYRVQGFEGGIVFCEVVNGVLVLESTSHVDWL